MNTYATLLVLSLVFSSNLTLAARLKVPLLNPQPSTRVTSTQSIRPEANALPTAPRETALAFAKKQFKLKEGDFAVKNAYTSNNGITHVYLRQLLKGIEITNADMNINVAKDGTILSYGSSFLPITPQVLSKSKAWDSATPKVTPAQAFQTFAHYLQLDAPKVQEAAGSTEDAGKKTYQLSGIPFARSNVPVDQAYVQTPDGTVLAAWRMQVPLSKHDNYYHAHVAADGSKVLRLIDWTKDASYNVYQIGDNDPDGAKRTLVNNPENKKASPNGWHDQGNGKKFTTTIGNNVYAQENWDGGDLYLDNKRPDGGAALKFDNPIDFTKEPKEYYEGAVTNLFYWNNVMHDVFYQYGFDEKSGNFQQTNFGKDGAGNDAVIANAQDGSGTDNANFESPPDGQNGRMRMYIFTSTTPNRDGDLSNDVIQHEYGHGISTRLTGGPANSDCLNDGESGGMGEGWSDFFAVMYQQKEAMTAATNFKMGPYVFEGKTIRNYEYSTSMTTNPSTYAYINILTGRRYMPLARSGPTSSTKRTGACVPP